MFWVVDNFLMRKKKKLLQKDDTRSKVKYERRSVMNGSDEEAVLLDNILEGESVMIPEENLYHRDAVRRWYQANRYRDVVKGNCFYHDMYVSISWQWHVCVCQPKRSHVNQWAFIAPFYAQWQCTYTEFDSSALLVIVSWQMREVRSFLARKCRHYWHCLFFQPQ